MRYVASRKLWFFLCILKALIAHLALLLGCRMIKAVIFDFDGVLVESVDIKTNAFAELFKVEGRKIARLVVGYHLRNAGVSRYEKFKYIYKNFLKRELTKEKFNALCANFAKLVCDEVVKSRYVRGAKNFLERYSSKYKLFVISATPQAEIEEIIKRRKMNLYFRGVYGAPISKFEAVRMILRRNRLKPVETVYVGDASRDYEAAVKYGLTFIARVRNDESIFDSVSCLKIKDLSALNRHISRLAQRLTSRLNPQIPK